MIPTLNGLVIILIGGYLLVASRVEAMLSLLMVTMLMAGSAAVIVTALGSSSIPPVSVVSGMLFIRLLFASGEKRPPWMAALQINGWYIIFAAYGILSAVLMPRIFAGQIDVAPLRPISVKGLFDVVPLQFTSQNITSPFYITGSMLTAVCSFLVMRSARGAITIVRSAVIVTWIHVLTGLAGVLLPAEIWRTATGIFRNGSYAQTAQSVGGYARITGIMPEPSTYAAYGFAWAVFMTECWLRDVMPKRTGPAAGAMTLILIFSTSTTAYISLAAYGLILLIRAMIFPTFFKQSKVIIVLASAIVFVTSAMLLLLLNPVLVDWLTKIFLAMTVEKVDSDSAEQRTFWAKQGIEAFKVSHGLGIGAGSFRSSNNITAILGSMGVIGIAAYLLYVIKVFRPLRSSTYSKTRDHLEAVGVACAWTTTCYIIPGLAGAPSPDPGPLFSLFAGAALGLRYLPLRVQLRPRPHPVWREVFRADGALPAPGSLPPRATAEAPTPN
ncbi:hypothetical protein [Sphingomonas crocodyli]|uniref:O-antigen ligase domain-containing protein n=1 Tax=Sphingomonas crocodyli TaxID=1979270 RepID=A0A437LXY3_9SPHN|nr:hypothetical protein [Sphingomonas crocodyli]RVT90183.1 hypothetical protein EOD43_17940 [Sphingomonas crocodyli]